MELDAILEAGNYDALYRFLRDYLDRHDPKSRISTTSLAETLKIQQMPGERQRKMFYKALRLGRQNNSLAGYWTPSDVLATAYGKTFNPPLWHARKAPAEQPSPIVQGISEDIRTRANAVLAAMTSGITDDLQDRLSDPSHWQYDADLAPVWAALVAADQLATIIVRLPR